VSATALGQVDVIWVHDGWMAAEGIVPAKRLLLGAQRTVHLLLAGIVDCVLVPGQIIFRFGFGSGVLHVPCVAQLES
jgi:hypothetical protein